LKQPAEWNNTTVLREFKCLLSVRKAVYAVLDSARRKTLPSEKFLASRNGQVEVLIHIPDSEPLGSFLKAHIEDLTQLTQTAMVHVISVPVAIGEEASDVETRKDDDGQTYAYGLTRVDSFEGRPCGLGISVLNSGGSKCPRCWLSHHDADTTDSLCKRCDSILSRADQASPAARGPTGRTAKTTTPQREADLTTH